MTVYGVGERDKKERGGGRRLEGRRKGDWKAGRGRPKWLCSEAEASFLWPPQLYPLLLPPTLGAAFRGTHAELARGFTSFEV